MKYVDNRLRDTQFDGKLQHVFHSRGAAGTNDHEMQLINVFFAIMKDENLQAPDGTLLQELVVMRMPFGKYKGVVLSNLPVSYLEWFAKAGFPPGKLGMLLATIYEIKINGLEYLLAPLKKQR